MKQRQQETLMRLFNEQQSLNLKLFKKELEAVGENMDYKSEKMSLEMSIYDSKKNFKELEKW